MTATEYKATRERLGMTQAALAVAMDVSRKAINEREKGGTITREAAMALELLALRSPKRSRKSASDQAEPLPPDGERGRTENMSEPMSNESETGAAVVLQRVVSQRRTWKTYPMGAAAAERMERRGMTAHLSHAVSEPCNQQDAALCGVLTYSLCMDDSLATDELPDCPKCKRKLANK